MVTQAEVHWIELDTVDSTNTHLMNAYQCGQVHGVVAMLARAQTAGRGRAGRSWLAQPGASVCLTVGVPLKAAPPLPLPLHVGIALATTLAAHGAPVRLKWPNDLLLQGGKLGGVLCESFHAGGQPHVVIGVGLNLSPMEVVLAPGALPVAALHGHPGVASKTPRQWAELLVPAMLAQMEVCLLGSSPVLPSLFAPWDAWHGLPLQVQDGGRILMRGTGMGVNSNGAYLLNTAGGLSAVHAGDLSLRVQP